MKYYIWLVLISVFCIGFLYADTDVVSELKQIPEQEQNYLEAFLRHLLFDEQAAYVLFGDKSMGIYGFNEIEDWHFENEIIDIAGFIFHVCHPLTQKIKKGWHVWKKYQHLFPEGNFLISDTKFPFSKTFHVIVMINRKEFVKKFKAHEDEFKSIMGKEITAHALIQKYMKEKENFYTVLDDHDGLLGILLGYGRKNAFLFNRRNQIDHRFWVPHFFSLTDRSKKPSENFQTVEQEALWLKKKLQVFPRSKKYIPHIHKVNLQLPRFMANFDLNETHEIEKKFLNQRHSILQKYKDGEFLQITLQQLFSK